LAGKEFKEIEERYSEPKPAGLDKLGALDGLMGKYKKSKYATWKDVMLRLVQLTHRIHGRCVAIVENDNLYRLNTYQSVYDLARSTLRRGGSLEQRALGDRVTEQMKYTPIYNGESDWRFLPAYDHPEETNRCLVSGTGLTHKSSAANRQAMHEKDNNIGMTDSMQIYQWGLEGGRPEPGQVGVQPEWFYKGHGSILRAHGDTLYVPAYAEDGGEEPEIAGAYIIDSDGKPWRLGFMNGNEFSDHIMEKQNYLYLAASKIRNCSIGPELVVGASFDNFLGRVCIDRNGDTVWSKKIKSGEANMSHTLANLEHHHFKYSVHRHPGDAHIHFYGADTFSFGNGIKLSGGDTITIEWEGLGRSLMNKLAINEEQDNFVEVKGIQ